MLDVAYACLIDMAPTPEGWVAVDEWLNEVPKAETLPRDELALRRALGVA